MRTHKVKGLIFLTTIILGFVLTSSLGASMTFTGPNTAHLDQAQSEDFVFLNSTSPIIDGDLESFEGEWENASFYNNEYGIGNNALIIRVLANETHLFLGMSYVSSIFIPVNTTIPSGDEYNNETHTWYAIVFDRNYDRFLGSMLAPDDAIVINYREEGAQDAFLNGTKLNSLVMDVDVSGIENSVANVSEYTGDFGEHIVTIEVAKALESNDALGSDVDLHGGESVDFVVMVLENETAIFNYTRIGEIQAVTSWNLIQFISLHDYFSYATDVSLLDVIIYVSETAASSYQNLSSIWWFLDQEGVNATIIGDDVDYEITYQRLAELELFILLGPQHDLSDEEIYAISLYAGSGGSVYVFADKVSASSQLNLLLSNFGMNIYNSYLYSTNTAVNSSIVIDSSEIEDLPFKTGTNIFTDQEVNSIQYAGSAINFTTDIGEGSFLNQEGDLYPIINLTGDYFIDEKTKGEYTAEDILLNDTIVQAGLELQRGGRIIVTASADLLNGSYITEQDNKYYFLNQIHWLMKLQNAINFEDYVVEKTHIIEGESISVTISAKSDNETVLTDLRAWVVVQELKSDKNNVTLTKHEDNVTFNGTIIPEKVKANFVDVSVRLHQRGYGYNETELVEVFLEAVIGKPIQVEIVATIIFVISIGLAAVGAFIVKKYKKPEVE